MENTPEKNPEMIENYDASNIQVLEGLDAVRKRPGMYIGSTGPQGLHHLVYEIVDNSIDEVLAGNCTKILVDLLPGDIVRVKDNGRGIPVGIQPKLGIPAVTVVFTVLHAGGKFGGGGYKVSGGLHGVGASVVNALSEWLEVEVCDGQYRYYQRFEHGKAVCDLKKVEPTTERGTQVAFKADPEIFTETTHYDYEVLLKRLREQAFLNGGVNITFTDERGEEPVSEVLHYEGGIRSFVNFIHEKKKNIWDVLHPDVIYYSGDGERSTVEVALQYNDSYNTTILSFANNIHTADGGTHEIGFRTALVKAFNDYAKKTGVFKKESDKFTVEDVLEGLTAIISVKLEEAQFEGQTKTKLGSNTISPEGETIRTFVGNFIARELDNYLHKNPETAKALEAKIKDSERDRKELSGIQKLARENARKAKIHNKNLRDCRVHYNSKHSRAGETTLFITEGISASGSITTARDAETQAVFSLRGKPLNSFGMSRKVVYENEEFNFLQHALNIENGLEELRYDKVVIATDADDDGMHIRILLMTFFIQFFPELIREGHLFILQTPLFRVRNKQQTIYCYSDAEREEAISLLGKNPEITRFKGLGEISPQEFKAFIGEGMRLDRVRLEDSHKVKDLLSFYMGKNTRERQEYILNNLRVELDPVMD